MTVKTCFQWLDHSQRRLCIKIAELMVRHCGSDAITLDPVMADMVDASLTQLDVIKADLEPAVVALRNSPGFLRRVKGLSNDAYGVFPELCGMWYSSGALLYDVSEPLQADRVQDLMENSEPDYWAGLVNGILDLPRTGCLYLALSGHNLAHRWRGTLVSWARLDNGDLRFRLVAETIDAGKTNLLSQGLRLRDGELVRTDLRLVREVNDMPGLTPEEALELCWEPITDNQGYYSMCLALLYLLQHRIIITSKPQTRPKKGTRRKGSSGSVSVTERTCKLDLDRWGRLVRRREKGRSGASQGTGTPRGPYQGPAKRVERYDREMWVREANVEAHEEWLDIKAAADGSALVKVIRVCNEAGYTIGCATEVSHTRATISFTESLTSSGDVNK